MISKISKPARLRGTERKVSADQKNICSISVVIPAYNEAECIEKCVVNLERSLKELELDFEIIVVNDASTDRTDQILEGLKASRPYLSVLHQQQNRGLGSALRKGFAQCQKEVSFYSDADLPFDFHELKKALRIMQLKDAHVIAGFRHDRTSEGWIRILYSLAYNVLVRLVYGLVIRDVNFSFKLIRTAVLQKMNLQSEGSFIDAEMMIKADRMRLFVCQIGIDYFKRRFGHSTLSDPKTIMKILKEMVVQYPGIAKIRVSR